MREGLQVVAAAGLLCVAYMASAADQARFDAAVEQTVERYQLPGIAVGVIEDGKVVYSRTVGERIAGSGEPIDADTLFKIASNTKAMTAAVLGRLVDAGTLRWDDPVTRHLPQFRMHDPWVTGHMQVRDLLIHNSGLGLGAGDLMLWPEPNDFDRDDIIAGLAHLEPAHSFRSHYAYDNLLYVVAGEVAAAAGGAPYEELVRREIFQPLGMDRCQVGQWRRDEVGNVAQPHRRSADGNQAMRVDEAVVPDLTSMAAGGIRCSLDDMLTWISTWLAPADDGGWLSPAQREAMWTAHMPMPVSARMRQWDRSRFSAYGYGWRLSDVDGHWKVAHTGTLGGMYSAVILLPDQRTGIVILINGAGEAARTVLGQVLTKHYTDPAAGVDVAGVAAALDQELAQRPGGASRLPDTSTRVPVGLQQARAWLGIYRDPWFGQVEVCSVGGVVRFKAEKSPRMIGTVMRVQQRLLVQWDPGGPDAEPWLVPDVATDGSARMTLANVDPDADFSYDYHDLAFSRTAACPPVVQVSAATDAQQAGLVDIATLIEDVQLDIRYFGSNNFVGAPVEGYEAPKCLLLAPAATALQAVARNLRAQGLAIKVFDCYRPVRSVAHFVRWARDPHDQRTKPEYYPRLEKASLLDGYIAETSGHSRGATVDLTLVRCVQGTCEELDMGTPFDFFDPRANTAHTGISDAQRGNRTRLVQAMAVHGFANYPMEWWHFSLRPEPTPGIAYDVPVR